MGSKPLQDILNRKPHLAWDIKDKENLSDVSALAHILGYGTWEDFLDAERLMGVRALSSLFHQISKGKRSNLRPATRQLFTNYFQAYG